MPKIRKETSNRRSSNDRAKLRKKIREGRRKNKRDAKKNPQWKSKTKKDPGIPSEFPYKDQILAEVAEQRRLAAEEKEKKRMDKQRALAKARAIAKGEPFEDSDAEGNSEGDEDGDEGATLDASKDLNVGADSIASLSAKFLTTELKPRPRPAVEADDEDEEEEDVPVLINRDLPNLKSVLEKADVVLEVVDGRDPLAFRSKHVEQLATDMGKKLLLVLNKIDACPREALASWSQQLRTQSPTLLFRAASSFLPEASVVLSHSVKKGKGKAKIPSNDSIGADSLLACLSQWSKQNKKDKHLVVAVVGVTNVGKSSLINSLLKRSALPVYNLASSSRGPTTTVLPQEVTLEIDDQTITLIDTPGLSFVSETTGNESTSEASRAHDILVRSKGRIDRLKDSTPPIAHIVSRANAEDLMLMYSLAAFTKGDPTAFLSGVARANQLVKKKGDPDLTGAARIVLRDWSVGKLLHYTTPPTDPLSANHSSQQPPAQESFIAQLYEKDESILASIPTRKERRKAGGLIKMSSSALEERLVAVEEGWAGLEDSEDGESDDDDDVEVDAEGMDLDEAEGEDEDEERDDDHSGEEEDEDEEGDEEEEEEEEEEEISPPPISNKQKRKRPLEAPPPERPSKKVAFAAQPSKRSRSTPQGKHMPGPATQQPLKSAQAPIKESAGPSKSKSKASSKIKAKPSNPPVKPAGKAPLENKSRVANVAHKKPQAPATTSKKGSDGPEAYDFGKFF